jgi:hypothetical protein
MQIKINDEKYNLYFGFDFINYIDEHYPVKVQFQGIDVPFGSALNTTINALDRNKKPTDLIKILKAGMVTLKSKPSNKDLEKYISNLIEDEEYDEFVEELLGKLKKTPLIKKEIESLNKQTEETNVTEEEALEFLKQMN